MTTPKTSSVHPVLATKLLEALSGVQQELPATFSAPFNGVLTTQAQLAAQIDAYQLVFQRLLDARTAYAQAVQARDAIDGAARDFLVQLKAVLVGFLGRGSPVLAKFGMSDRKAAPLTAQGNALRAAKAKLTREKRGTLGRRQRLAIVALGTPQVTFGAGGAAVTPSVGEVAESAAAHPPAASAAPSAAPSAAANPTPATVATVKT